MMDGSVLSQSYLPPHRRIALNTSQLAEQSNGAALPVILALHRRVRRSGGEHAKCDTSIRYTVCDTQVEPLGKDLSFSKVANPLL